MELTINGYEDRQKLVAILVENGYAVMVEVRKTDDVYNKENHVVQIHTSF